MDDFATFAAQDNKQKQEMAAFMKAMGAEMGGEDDAAADAFLCKELGLDPAEYKNKKNEDDELLAQILAGGDEEMDDEALLAALAAEENEKLNQVKLEEAEELKEQAEKEKVNCQTLNKQGKKPEALV